MTFCIDTPVVLLYTLQSPAVVYTLEWYVHTLVLLSVADREHELTVYDGTLIKTAGHAENSLPDPHEYVHVSVVVLQVNVAAIRLEVIQ